ncbi:hypothetical protein [Amycolatopsis sp. NPDC054798]
MVNAWVSAASALLSSLAAILGVIISRLAVRRREREVMAKSSRALTQLREEAAKQAVHARGEPGGPAENREILNLLLHADEIQILRRTKQGVALDLAQLCSATALPPSRARNSVKRLLGLGLLETERDEHGPGSGVRYRKQVADSLIGGGE